MILLRQGHIFLRKTVLNNFQLSFKIEKAFTNSFTFVGLEINHQSNTIDVSKKAFVKSFIYSTNPA